MFSLLCVRIVVPEVLLASWMCSSLGCLDACIHAWYLCDFMQVPAEGRALPGFLSALLVCLVGLRLASLIVHKLII